MRARHKIPEAPKAPQKRSYGCFTIIAAVIAVLAVIEFFDDTDRESREYIAPINSQEVIAQFAASELNYLQPKSFADGVEYCGMIYETRDGKLVHEEISKGDSSSCDFGFEYGGKYNPVASFHTHGGHDADYDNEAPSVLDVEEDIKNKVDGYIATPGGRLWHVDWKKRTATQVCGEKCLKQDPDYEPCPAYPVAKSYTIEALEKRVENDPERC